ncbi:hypothetical protein U1Q18_052615 [Sarracenia purpurea var. burkii]
MWRVFPSSLGEMALRWFNKLSSSSVRGWRQLAELFATRFITNSRQSREIDSLLSMRESNRETLRQYAQRNQEAFNEIDDCIEQLAIASFKQGLDKIDKLRHSLTKRLATTIAELMQRIDQYIKVEEDLEVSAPEQNIEKMSSRLQEGSTKKEGKSAR